MYLTFAQYGELGGTLDEPTFNRFERQARTRIKALTHGRVSLYNGVIPVFIQELTFDLITELERFNSVDGISSTNIDGVSVSYAETDTTKRLDKIILTQLSGEIAPNGVPFLYGGL